MKKVAIALALVLGLLFAGVWLSLNSILRDAISDGATRALGVESGVGIVRLRIFAGKLGLTSVEVANPEGFDEDHFLEVGSAAFEVKLATVRDEVIEVPLIEIHDVDVALEREGDRTNFGVILEHMRAFEKGKAPPPEEPGAEQRFVVRRLRIENVKARVEWSSVASDQTGLAVEIPEIELHDVGEKGGGVTTAQLSNLVVKTVLTAIAKQGEMLPLAMLSELNTGLRGVAGIPSLVLRGTGGALGAAADAVGGEEVGEAVRELGDEAAGGLDAIEHGAEEALGGLFGKKKKEEAK